MRKPLLLLVTLLIWVGGGLAGENKSTAYYVYVTAESEDRVELVRFDGKSAEIVKSIPVGEWPFEIEGPHGIIVSPDGKHWYLSLAHGKPFGYVYKYATGSDEVIGRVELGMFPATMDISRATGLLYVVNFNLHGDHVPSSVSVVDPESLTEVERVETGIMPHGSRVAPDGLKHYSVAMMSDKLFEVDALSLEVTRTLFLGKKKPMGEHAAMGHDMKKPMEKHAAGDKDKKPHGDEHAGMDHDKGKHEDKKKPMGEHAGMKHEKKKPMGEHADMDHGEMNAGSAMAMAASAPAHKMHKPVAKPTWVYPHPTEAKVYVANNGAAEVVEVDTKAWKITRRFSTDKGPYNLEISRDGKYMVVTYKSAGGTGIWDLKKGKELANIKNSRLVTHGVCISPDSKYAFVSVEGKGGEPGSVDIFDLSKQKLVETVNTGKQAGGIAFWKIDR